MAKETIPPLEAQMREWFRQYGSHVILHRAVPHINDGLKPSQRRVLHALKTMDDGRFNKVAGVVGETMKYHPHGDMSIFETMVTIGQKGYLIETQGNWGNILTGDGPAASRYIEARLTPFAKECLYNPKITEWAESYDGRNKEPVSLPAKFPMLLLQGTEGIAVSMACKIMPHNFGEICAAAIAYLKNEPFTLLPDFPQGGSLDASAYCLGETGGKIKVRARIETGKHSLEIKELPFGTTTVSLRESILKAEERGKIKIKKIHDMTSEGANLIVELPPGSDLERTKDALYAFTDCEVAHTVSAVVIDGGNPVFLGTQRLLERSVDHCRDLLKKELEMELAELGEQWHKLSLERIFIRTKAYLELETAENETEAVMRILEKVAPELGNLRKTPVDEDIRRLTELRLRRISRYDEAQGAKDIETVEKKERETKKRLKHLTETTIEHFAGLLQKYGKNHPRKTEVTKVSFGKIEVAEVAVSNQKLYWNPKEGFIGTGLKKDEPLPFEINDLTDVGAINGRGVLRISRPGQKAFFGENLLDARPVGRSGECPIYNMIYMDMASGTTYGKRFQIDKGFIRDKDYPLAGGAPENRVLFLKVDTEKAPRVEIKLGPDCGARKKELEFDFGSLSVKSRDSQGNIVTRYPIKTCKES